MFDFLMGIDKKLHLYDHQGHMARAFVLLGISVIINRAAAAERYRLTRKAYESTPSSIIPTVTCLNCHRTFRVQSGVGHLLTHRLT